MKRKRQIILLVALVLLAAMGLFVTSGLSEGMKVELQGINLNDKPDGDYMGTYSFQRWTNTLLVHVKDHRITGIDIQDDVGAAQITHCSDEVFRRVIEAQNTKVDAVSGATVTSKAYLKAIENALS